MSAPFGDVERDLAQRLIGVRRIHLIGVLAGAAELLGRAHGLAERTVEARGILGRVGENAGVHQARRLERRANGADAAVHHVGRGDHVRSGVRVRARLAHQRFDGEVVLHVACVVDQPVLAVRRERIESDVRDDAECSETPSSRRAPPAARCPRDSRTRARPGSFSRPEPRGTRRSRGWRAARCRRTRAAAHRPTAARRRASSPPLDAASCPPRRTRVDQRIGGELRLAHQAARELIAAHPPQAGGWK